MPSAEENFPVYTLAIMFKLSMISRLLICICCASTSISRSASGCDMLTRKGDSVPVQTFLEGTKPMPASTHAAHDVKP